MLVTERPGTLKLLSPSGSVEGNISGVPAVRTLHLNRLLAPPSEQNKAQDDRNMKNSGSTESQSASELIDKKIAGLGDWRGETLSRMRKLIKEADSDVVEEWKIDIHEGEELDAAAFKALIRAAAALNTSAGKGKPGRAK